MSQLRFEWDFEKAAKNLSNHGVSFEEATTAFDDQHRLIEFDEAHSQDEERFRLVGLSNKPRLLTVIFTETYETIRVISARRATKAESRRYTDQAQR